MVTYFLVAVNIHVDLTAVQDREDRQREFEEVPLRETRSAESFHCSSIQYPDVLDFISALSLQMNRGTVSGARNREPTRRFRCPDAIDER